MSLLADATAFINKLLHRRNERCCPRCSSTLTKRNGSRPRTLRDLGGVRTVDVQRHLCLECKRSYSDEVPEIKPYHWYTRRVQRKFLDMYTTIGGSLRRNADWLTAEITGCGRTFIWDVLARAPWWGRAPEPEPEIALSHTTGWRWVQAAGDSWRKREKAYADVPQSGAVASDATYVRIRGVWTAILRVVDGIKRTTFGLFHLATDESDEEIERAFDLAAKSGLILEQIKVFASDGASGFREFLARCLHWVRHQRCIFHLWRNVLPIITRYAAVAGDEWAEGLKTCIACVWNASSTAEAEVMLKLLIGVYGAQPIAQEAVRLVQETFEQAMTHLVAGLPGVSRTSCVCEWVWRYYKERVAQMGGFMSTEGCDHFNAIWEVALNFRRYQRRKERLRHYMYPGLCPLEVAGVMVQNVTSPTGRGGSLIPRAVCCCPSDRRADQCSRPVHQRQQHTSKLGNTR
jgi:transposase-like protein